jgi:EAL domain-containing protein (putative c-di-GMP-specific phosphodiesterase class I)
METKREIQHMTKNGCGHAQGFAIAHPLLPAETSAWLRDYMLRRAYTRQTSHPQ